MIVRIETMVTPPWRLNLLLQIGNSLPPHPQQILFNGVKRSQTDREFRPQDRVARSGLLWLFQMFKEDRQD